KEDFYRHLKQVITPHDHPGMEIAPLSPHTKAKSSRSFLPSRTRLIGVGFLVVALITLVFAVHQIGQLSANTSIPTASIQIPTGTLPPTLTPILFPTNTPSVTPPPTLLGGGPGQIAFVSSFGGNDEIYVMNVYGGNLRNLTNNTADDTHPAWSSDGTQIA